MLKTGDIVKINVPHPMPQPFSGMTTGWVRFITGIDGKEVTLSLPEAVPLPSSQGGGSVDGWKIHCNYPSFTRSWAPSAWLIDTGSAKVMAPALKKIPCNCPWNSVLQSGCKNPQHE